MEVIRDRCGPFSGSRVWGWMLGCGELGCGWTFASAVALSCIHARARTLERMRRVIVGGLERRAALGPMRAQTPEKSFLASRTL